jgi:hypothetical protein
LVNAQAADVRCAAEETRFSVCTLVTDWAQYEAMQATFRSRGFVEPETEFLYLDNSQGNRFDGFTGVSVFLTAAKGRRVILCHQDVRLLQDDASVLSSRLTELDALDPRWAVVGNAGGVDVSRLAIRISDPHGKNTSRGPFPSLVSSLDENFLVVRRSARLTVSRDLGGFHLYASDLCTVAAMLGWTSYVIDFHLQHLSPGTADARYDAAAVALVRKYESALKARWVVTPTSRLFLSSSRWLNRLMNTTLGRSLARRWVRLFT